MDNKERTLKCSEFGNNFVKKLQELWKHGKYCDAEIEVGSRVFKFHKLVLAVASPSFLDTKHGVSSDRLQIQLPIDVDILALDNVLHYLYGNNLVISSHQVDTVLKLGNLFKIKTIIEFCEEFIQSCDTGRPSSRKRATYKREPVVESDEESDCTKKPRTISSKLPAPVLKRNCARRGAKSIRGSRTSSSPVVSPKITTPKLRGRGRGRGRGGHTSIRSPIRLLANSRLKNADKVKPYDTDNDSKSSSPRKSKRTSTITSGSYEDNQNDTVDEIENENKQSVNDTEKPLASSSEISRILTENPDSVFRPNGYIDIKNLAHSLGIKPYSGYKIGTNKKIQKKEVTELPIDLFDKPYLEVNDLQHLSQTDLQLLLRRQLNVEKQRRYRAKMRHDPEYRRRECERVRRRYVPMSMCNIQERRRRRNLNKKYVRQSRLRKKLGIPAPSSRKATHIENNEHYSGELFVPHDSEFYLCNNIENNVDTVSQSGVELDISAIKQEVADTIEATHYVPSENHFNHTAVSETQSENAGDDELPLPNISRDVSGDNRELTNVHADHETAKSYNNPGDSVAMETHSMETIPIKTHSMATHTIETYSMETNPVETAVEAETPLVNDIDAVENIPESNATVTYHVSENDGGEIVIEEQSNFDNCSSFRLRNSENSNIDTDSIDIHEQSDVADEVDTDADAVNETT